MTTDVKFRDRYTGEIDGQAVAAMYRAFNEPTQPFCVYLPQYNLAFAQQPSIIDADPEYDEQSTEEHEAQDRENAVAWVDLLTELVWKAREYDEMMQAIFEAEDLEFPFPQIPTDVFDVTDWLPLAARPTKVDVLTEAESDREWVDRDGDKYKFVDGCWLFMYSAFTDWDEDSETAERDSIEDFGPYTVVEPVGVQRLTRAEIGQVWQSRTADRFKFENGCWHIKDAFGPPEYYPVYVASLLSAWGPYTVVEPRKVKALGVDERDAVWTYQAENSSVLFTYRWDQLAGTWMGTHTSDCRGPGEWDSVGSGGPYIGSNNGTYLVEVL